MKNAYMVLLMVLSVVALTTTPAFALRLVAEKRIESASGAPVNESVTFRGQGYEDFVLKVENGEANGSRRVSSALVSLNGVKVLGPADFNQKIHTLERSIAPQNSENTLSISLRSNPGGFLNIQVLGEQLIELPPDPGPAGEETIEGIDVNANGVRDDIERWIWLNYGDSEKTRQALFQVYYPLQNFMIHARQGDRDAVYNDMTALQRASECLKFVRPSDAYSLGNELQAQVINTTDRVHAYRDSSRMLGGGSFPNAQRSKWKESCTFNPIELTD